jgi:ATP-dependent DNA helicase RecQ
MSTKGSRADAVRAIARDRFHFDALRPGQERAIRSVLSGRDTLAVMPTGFGKSAIYQIAGLLIPGATVVVSPLIALQRDQVRSISETDAGGAEEINSMMNGSQRGVALAAIDENDVEFIFLAPEQFSNDEAMAHLEAERPSLFVVDEAHLISEWGHDFRPDYLRLGAVIEKLGHPTVLALTATAAPPVRNEIIQRLGVRDPIVIVQGFDRPNISLSVETFTESEDKREALLDRVEASAKPGIVYAATRNGVEEIAEALRGRGIDAAPYHAGLKPAERETRQTWFMDNDDGVIVATIAFGMGIDKPNVRFVFHHDVAGSLDAYYQEFGRAGRDGGPAEAVLFYRPEDLALRRFQGGMGSLDVEEVKLVLDLILLHHGQIDLADLLASGGSTESKLTRMLARLEDAGFIESGPDGAVLLVNDNIDSEATAARVVAAQENLNRFAQSRVEMMRAYAEQPHCRRAFLLNYFGEDYEAPCGNCDNCRAGHGRAAPPADRDFAVNSAVIHEKWGPGVVMRHEDDRIIVLFETVGYRTLDAALVRDERILKKR